MPRARFLCKRLLVFLCLLLLGAGSGCAPQRVNNLPVVAPQVNEWVRNFQGISKELLKRDHQNYPNRPFCDIDAMIARDGILVSVGPTGVRGGLQPGDRIVAVNGTRHDHQELFATFKQYRPDEQLLLTVVRDTIELDRKIPCMDGRPHIDARIAMFEAASDGRWQECMDSSYHAERPPGGPFSDLAEIRFYCRTAERITLKGQFNSTDARLFFEWGIRELEEAQYLPAGVAGVRSQILEKISTLEQNKFTVFSKDLRTQLEKASTPGPVRDKKIQQVSTGTCFAVGPNGSILTSYHVVNAAKSIKIYLMDGRSGAAEVASAAVANDLALLRISERTPAYLTIAPPRSTQVGQSVFTMGFPATSLLGMEPKFSDGSISALSGPGGEASLMQISVPIQPGNSGGPLVNNEAQVVGVITATAAILPFVTVTGSLPQNVNWAIKADYAQLLFTPHEKVSLARTRQEAIDQVRRALCLVEASTN